MEGPNKGFYFDGQGGASTNTFLSGTPCWYGGVVYGYNDTTMRIWRPDDPLGAAVCIGVAMGHGSKSQSANYVNFVLSVWRIGEIRKFFFYFCYACLLIYFMLTIKAPRKNASENVVC